MTDHKSAVTEVETLVQDLPKLSLVSSGGESHVYEVNSYDALIKTTVILTLSGDIVPGVSDITDSGLGKAIRSQERAATHTGINVSLF
jgi:hypothetical protein